VPPATRAPLKLAAAAPEAAPKPPKTHLVWQDEFVKVVSDENLSKAKAQAVAKKIEAAAKFDAAQQKWPDSSPLGKQITVEVLSKKGFDALLGGDAGGTAGVTLGPDLMAVPDTVATKSTPDDDDTLAHEVVHVQDERIGGDRVDLVPTYLQEGKAYVLGDSYPIALHEDGNDPVLGTVAKQVGGVTAKQAQDVIDHYRDPEAEEDPNRNGFVDETTGALYVEYLRTRLNGTGVADTIPRLAKVISDVGKGASYEDAFKKQFGVSVKDSEQGFVKYVKDTEGRPADRLDRTLWRKYLPAQVQEPARKAA
jgi:hypothetical protein